MIYKTLIVYKVGCEINKCVHSLTGKLISQTEITPKSRAIFHQVCLSINISRHEALISPAHR